MWTASTCLCVRCCRSSAGSVLEPRSRSWAASLRAASSSSAGSIPGVRITGTVPDVRPYLWGSAVSVVPLRIGGGTRLKIYESMAAGVPVVSTTIGAEGLDIHPGQDIRIADRPEDFAAHCVDLLEDADGARRLAARARDMVAANFSWEQVARSFSNILEHAPSAAHLSSSAAGVGK